MSELNFQFLWETSAKKIIFIMFISRSFKGNEKINKKEILPLGIHHPTLSEAAVSAPNHMTNTQLHLQGKIKLLFGWHSTS